MSSAMDGNSGDGSGDIGDIFAGTVASIDEGIVHV